MADTRKFEDDIIRWLLNKYGLLQTRTKWMLLDIEEQICSYEENSELDNGNSQRRPRMLTFRAFKEFFPGFPVHLTSASLTGEDCQRMAFPKPFSDFEKTRLGRDFFQLDFQHRRVAIFHRWPYQKKVLVLHNLLPLNTDLPGVHCCWRVTGGNIAIIQELPGFVATLKEMSGREWQSSAIDPNYANPVFEEDQTP